MKKSCSLLDILRIKTGRKTVYEILAFSVLLLLTVIVVAGCVCRKKINIIQAMAIVTMVIFLGIVFGSTVFTRTSTIRQYELIPFWSWKAIFKYKDWELLKENLLNCILLLPAGALLPIIANHKVKWYRTLLFGVLVSAVIETSQLVFMRGLFEWDDMIHNGLNKVDKVVEEGVLNMLSIVLGDIFPVFLAQISARSREVKDFSFITFSM